MSFMGHQGSQATLAQQMMMVSFLLHTNMHTPSNQNSSYKYIYPKRLELKLEHLGEHATYSDLDTTIKDNIFVYKPFDKRSKFSFFIVRMPYLVSNFPSSIFYESIFSEFLRIARCALRLTHFVPMGSHLYARMITQGGNKAIILRQIKQVFQRYPETVL